MSIVRIAIVALFAALGLAEWVPAQTMTVTGVTGVTLSRVDEDETAWYDVNFTVKNTGTQAAPVYAIQNCGPFCGPGGGSSVLWYNLAPNQTTTIPVRLMLPVWGEAGSGIVSLSVQPYTSGYLTRPPDDVGYAMVNLASASATPITRLQRGNIAITPNGTTTAVGIGAQTMVFTITNRLTNTVAVPMTLSLRCGGFLGRYEPAFDTWKSCGMYDGGGNAVLNEQTNFSVSVKPGSPVAIPVALNGGHGQRGQVRLIGSVVDPVTHTTLVDTATVLVLTGDQRQPDVSPKGGAIVAPPRLARVDSFTVRNAGTALADYVLTPNCGAFGASGCVASPAALSIAPGGSARVGVWYTAGAGNGSSSLISLVATVATPGAVAQRDTGSIVVTARDVSPPGIAIAPAQGEILSLSAFTAAISACDDGILKNPTVTFNGVVQPDMFIRVTQPGCVTAGTWIVGLRAQPGANTLTVSVSDDFFSSTLTRTFVYDDATEVAPQVAPVLAAVRVPPGVAWADTFTVRNPGPIAAQYSITASCGAFGACMAQPSSVVIAAGATVKVAAAYPAPTAGGLATTIQVTAAHTSATGHAVSASASLSATIIPIAVTDLAMSPAEGATYSSPHFAASVTWCDTDDAIVSRQVWLAGVLLPDTFVPQGVPGCVSAGTSSWANLTLLPWSQELLAQAIDAAGHVARLGRTVTYTPSVAAFAPVVTPKNVQQTVTRGTVNTITFLITNGGSYSAAYSLTASCGAFTACQSSKAAVTLAPGARDSAHVTFLVPTAIGAFSPIRLTARYTAPTGATIADSGQVTASTPTAYDLFQPRVTAGTPLMLVTPGWIPFLTYTIRNLGSETATYAISIETPNDYGFVAPHVPITSITLGPGQTGDVGVQPRTPYWISNRTDAVVARASYRASDGTTVASADSTLVTLKAGLGGVAVTPRLAEESISRAFGGEYDRVFQVRNTGTVPLAVALSAVCDSLITRCTTTPNSVYLAEGASANVGVTFFAGDFQRGHLKLRAAGGYNGQTIADEGVINFHIDDAAYHAVRVSPDSVDVEIPSGEGQQFFTITNVGGAAASYRYTTACENASSQSPLFQNCAGAVTNRTTASIPSGQSATIGVPYAAFGGVGLKGRIRIAVVDASDATTSANGVARLTTALLRPIAVDIETVGATTTTARDQCLTIGAAVGVAYECADLRLVHPLPATTTMNTTRAPTLVYNSRHHSGIVLFPANVRVEGGFAATQLEAKVFIGPFVETQTFAWRAEWSDGTPRRIVVPVNVRAWGLGTGAYSYTLSVRAIGESSSQTAQADGVAAVINRSSTQFGPGWWLDGLEQIVNVVADTAQKLWIGGDGSTRLYTRQGPGRWTVVPSVDRPDSLTWSEGRYYRWLAGDAYVEFSNNGQHVATRNSHGAVTRFAYANVNHPFWLTSITLPVPTGSAAVRQYVFSHAADSAFVTHIDAPTAPGQPLRRTRLTFQPAQNGVPVLARITDVDGQATTFSHDSQGRVRAATDRRGYPTWIGFDAAGGIDSIVPDVAGTAPYSNVRRFCPAETATRSSCSGASPIDTASVRTRYAGPRQPSDVADTTWFHVTRYGAPAKIVNALLETTIIERSDARWPLLATGVVSPNGHRVATEYDVAHGLPRLVADRAPYGGADAITTYEWNVGWRRVLSVVAPPGGGSTRFEYDPLTGNRVSQRDGRGDQTKTVFYYTDRRLDSLISPEHTTPGHRATTYAYDALGNLSRVTTPLGIVTEIVGDYLGRDSVVYSPTDAANPSARRVKQTFVYDVMDRVTRTTSVGEAASYAVDLISGGHSADTLVVDQAYDANGNLTESRRRGSKHAQPLFTTWTYDALNRRVTETNHAGLTRRWSYDAAGNMTADSSPRRDPRTGAPLVIRMRYDAANRLMMRITPSVTYPSESCVAACPGFPGWLAINAPAIRFPYFQKWRPDGSLEPDVVLPSDTARFTYTKLGAVETAENRDAKIYRDYYPNGALKLDSLRIAVYDRVETPYADPYARHGFALRYTYDAAGHRRTRTDNVPTFAGNVQSYDYDPGSGQLIASTDVGTSASFQYDAASRIRRLAVGPSFVETRGYNDDDLLERRTNNIYDDLLSYDARGKVTEAEIVSSRPGLSERRRMAYSGLGALVATSRVRGASVWTDEYDVDGFANVLAREANRFDVQQHRRYASNVLDGQTLVDALVTAPDSALNGAPPPEPLRRLDRTSYAYDAAGNQTGAAITARKWMTNGAASAYEPTLEGSSWTRSYYDAENRLRVFQETGFVPMASGFTRRTTFVEYRYDALGRRVLMRTQRDTACVDTYCGTALERLSVIDRFVWDGDQLLYEYRASANYATHGEALEIESTSGPFTGVVHYLHAGGIDQPLALWRDGNAGYVPFLSWRGGFEAVSRLDGSDPQIYMPAVDREAYHAVDSRRSPQEETYWLGSLVNGQMDLSGLMYMRNRYYDPKAGRFTQEDPIGLAGGMNLYGFAGGDPVNSSDPFGLCPPASTFCLLSGVFNTAIAKAKGAGQAIKDLTPLGDAERAADAFSQGRSAAGAFYGASAALSVIPGGGGAKVAKRIVIGETADRVEAYAAKITADTFTPVATDFIGMMRENAKWLREKITQGYEIIDIGFDPNRAKRGPFYAAERKIVERTGANVIRP